MPIFKCREFDRNRGKHGRIESSDGDWQETPGGDSEDAAESFASALWDDSPGEMDTKFSVEVLLDDGTIERWDVEVEFEPVFYLTLHD